MNFKYKSGLEGKLIWSVYQTGRTEKENFLDYQQVRTELRQRGVRAIPVLGTYRGIMERSFIVSDVHLSVVLALADSCQQESILWVKHDNTAHLLYISSKPTEQLGSCWRVSQAIAEQFDCWTLHEDSGAIWICG